MIIRILSVPILALSTAGAAVPQPLPEQVAAPDTLIIPQSIRDEHLELLAALLAAGAERGPVGEAARSLTGVLQPHFAREERFALPPLGLLAPLADNYVPPAADGVLALTDSLVRELPRMLEEHRQIDAAIARFEAVARAEHVYRYELLAVALRRHARTEEEVLYPAAVLVGDVVRARGMGFRRR